MQFTDIITTLQVLVGIVLLVISVWLAFRTRRKVSEDLRRRWAMLVGFLLFFIIGYFYFLYLLFSRLTFKIELVTGSIFLAGGCFVVLMVMLSRTTVSRLIATERELRVFNRAILARTIELEHEISERIKAEERLEESEEKYRSLVESTDDSIYVVDRNLNYVFMNKRHQKRLGLPGNSYVGRSYSEFHSPKQTEWFSDSIEEVFLTHKSSQHEYRSERDGRYFLQTMSPVEDQEGRIVAVSVISKNISSMKQMEEELRMLSLTDDMTGLYNRRGFFTLAEQQLKMANRLKKGVSLLYVDLDYLKLINDTMGHREGDKALIKLAEILKATYRTSDIVARIGGDEFVVFPVEIPNGDLGSVTERLQENIQKSNETGENRFELSISTGIAYYDPEDPIDLEELLTEADKSMYEQKKLKPQF